MTRLVLIRHAQSYSNANAIVGGRGSDPKITEKGYDQALEAGEKLHNQYGGDFDYMVISGLSRTNQTAAIINQFLEIETISYDREIQEKDYGIYEGKSLNEHRADIHLADYNEAIPGGESEKMFVERVAKSLCVYLQGKDSLALIVSHGHTIKMANKYFLDKEEYIMNAAFVEIAPEEIIDLAGKCSFDTQYTIDECVESNVV